jgi:hypothetical protein
MLPAENTNPPDRKRVSDVAILLYTTEKAKSMNLAGKVLHHYNITRKILAISATSFLNIVFGEKNEDAERISNCNDCGVYIYA